MPSRELDFPVFDADNHMYETPDAFTKYLPSEYAGLIKYVQVDGRTKIAVNGQISEYIPNPTFASVAAPGAQEEYFKRGNPGGSIWVGPSTSCRDSPTRSHGWSSWTSWVWTGPSWGPPWPACSRSACGTTPRRSTPWCMPSTSGCTSTGRSTTRIGSSQPP